MRSSSNDEVRAAGLDAPWFHPGPLIQPKKLQVQSGLWKWDKIEPLVRSTPDFVAPGKGAERRILRIANPGVAELTATHTISIAFQYLMPGEVAPAHRHSPNAMRFMIDGEGAYTTVNGDKCMMHPGDVILTPGGRLARSRQRGPWARDVDGHPRFAGGALSRSARRWNRIRMKSRRPAPRTSAPSGSILRRAWCLPDTPPKRRSSLLAYRWEKAREALDAAGRGGERSLRRRDARIRAADARAPRCFRASRPTCR